MEDAESKGSTGSGLTYTPCNFGLARLGRYGTLAGALATLAVDFCENVAEKSKAAGSTTCRKVCDHMPAARTANLIELELT